MSVLRLFHRARRALSRFRGDSHGGVLVEFGIVISLFFLLMFVALDFGRFAYGRVMAQKAADIAVRIAVVRSPACAGLPETNLRGPVPNNTIPPRFGTSCNAATGTCAAVATLTCTGDASNPTAWEIWNRIDDLLPVDATIDNLVVSYSFDSDLGFLGGPYTPMVTVDLNLPDFQFISPIGGLITATTGTPTAGPGPSAARGSFSVSLPAEDLNVGDQG